MSRSLKKSLYINPRLEKKFEAANQKGIVIAVKVYDRGATITPAAIKHTVLIYNGKKLDKRQITPDMVGDKYGVYSPTRKSGQHGKAGTH